MYVIGSETTKNGVLMCVLGSETTYFTVLPFLFSDPISTVNQTL